MSSLEASAPCLKDMWINTKAITIIMASFDSFSGTPWSRTRNACSTCTYSISIFIMSTSLWAHACMRAFQPCTSLRILESCKLEITLGEDQITYTLLYRLPTSLFSSINTRTMSTCPCAQAVWNVWSFWSIIFTHSNYDSCKDYRCEEGYFHFDR